MFGITFRKKVQLSRDFKFISRWTPSECRKILIKSGAALSDNYWEPYRTKPPGREPTWFYRECVDRGASSQLTNVGLKTAEIELTKNHPNLLLLDTGCGYGSMSFHLEDKGFEVEGWDLYQPGIDAANTIKSRYGYKSTFRVVDCINPSPEIFNARIGKFNVITVLYWFMVAVSDSQGSTSVKNPLDTGVRRKFLEDFLSKYVQLLAPDGIILIEVVDACADYRLREEQESLVGNPDLEMLPLRYRLEDVEHVALKVGLQIELYKISVCNESLQPSALYSLRKIS